MRKEERGGLSGLRRLGIRCLLCRHACGPEPCVCCQPSGCHCSGREGPSRLQSCCHGSCWFLDLLCLPCEPCLAVGMVVRRGIITQVLGFAALAAYTFVLHGCWQKVTAGSDRHLLRATHLANWLSS